MNALGNRHLSNNLRILVTNNGKGTEFRMYWHPAAQFGNDADHYVAAGGHFGDKSPQVVKAYVESLGFEYMSANSKEEFLEKYEHFISSEQYDRPLVFEVFTVEEEESKAIFDIRHSIEDEGYQFNLIKNQAKSAAASVLGKVKGIIKK
jgi:2-succinyl-5-enolpyruvyl-6-hydroxy-3-cyclohexene-1-carboxylate synthase